MRMTRGTDLKRQQGCMIHGLGSYKVKSSCEYPMVNTVGENVSTRAIYLTRSVIIDNRRINFANFVNSNRSIVGEKSTNIWGRVSSKSQQGVANIA